MCWNILCGFVMGCEFVIGRWWTRTQVSKQASTPVPTQESRTIQTQSSRRVRIQPLTQLQEQVSTQVPTQELAKYKHKR